MCEKQKRIDELETALHESAMREATLFKTLAEAKHFEANTNNLENQIVWRPWQVVMIPIVISLLALIAAVAK